MKDETTPLIVDTDPGVDDAVALFYLSLMSSDVSGLTTVHGNNTINTITNNTVYLRDRLFDKARVGVYKGSSESLDGKVFRAKSSGHSGLGNLIIPPHRGVANKSAENFLKRTLQNNSLVTIIALGPLTNIANLIVNSPDLAQKIGALYVMGGVFGERGNITEFAEFNVYCDPTAWKITMDFCFENHLKTIIVPADVCRKVVLTRDDVTVLNSVSKKLHMDEIVGPYLDYYLNDSEYGGYEGAVIYDLLVPLFIHYPEYFQTEAGSIDVETSSNDRLGMTTFIPNSKASLEIVRDVSALDIKQRFIDDILKSAQK